MCIYYFFFFRVATIYACGNKHTFAVDKSEKKLLLAIRSKYFKLCGASTKALSKKTFVRSASQKQLYEYE